MRLAECVAAALAGAAEQGSWVAAPAALKPLDPLLRAFGRRRVRRALERARRETTVDDPGHQLRLAALLALGPLASDLERDDPSAVARALAARGLGAIPRQKPWWTLGAVLGAALLAAALAIVPRYFRPFDARETAVGEVLGAGLTELVQALGDPRRAEQLARAREKATGTTAQRALGEDGSKRLARVVDAAENAARTQGSGLTTARDAFLAAADDFSVFLGRSKLPYFVDADVLDSGYAIRPVLMSSYVEREVELEGGGHRVRALHLWRLDRVGMFGVLGYTRPRTPVALVLLDQVETDLVRWVLPALPAGERMEVVDEETLLRNEDWAIQAELKCAAIVRRHYAPLLDAEVTHVGKILARRRALIRKWRGSLSGQGITLRVPDRLIPEADYAKDLEIRITRPNLREWDEIHAELLEPQTLAAFGRVRDRYTLSIERHEAQHRLDFQGGFLPLPAIAARLTGVQDPLDLPEGSLGAHTRNELSAYLAQLVESADSPQLDLVLMVRLGLNRGSQGGAHAIAAAAALLVVGQELGIDPEEYLSGGLGRRELAELLVRVAERKPEEIRSAAQRAYATSFGHELPQVKRKGIRENRTWRH
ncbi:MAG TPA: hypothetical protein VGK73_19820 [Polyangiaceae bacterium]